MNVAYATTHGWNVGDDFIRMGCERIIEHFYPRHNRLIYDKAPHVRGRDGNPRQPGDEFHGNSLEPDKDGDLHLDLMVVAGTPENTSGRMMKFFHLHADKAIALGLGASGGFVGNTAERYRSCLALTCRDPSMERRLTENIGRPVKYLPCPALFSASALPGRVIYGVGTIGLGWKCDQSKGVKYNILPASKRRAMIALYRKMMKERPEYDYEIVCHHIDEVADAMAEFPGIPVRCSYHERDFIDIYSNYDFVVTPRVHGCGMAASLGIPSVMLPTDFRSRTCEGFMAPRIRHWDDTTMIWELVDHVKELNAKLRQHKVDTWNAYIELLKPVLG